MRNSFYVFLRLLYIHWIIFRYSIDDIITLLPAFSSFRLLTYLNPCYLYNHRISRGERLRRALIKLGPIFVKFGQVLSTRRDLLPDDIINGLTQLQDKVPAFSAKKAEKIIEKAYGVKLSDILHSFDKKPLASASIAQVHSAILNNSDQVIIKVLRPKIKKQIKRDLALLYTLARVFQRFSSHGKRLRAIDVVSEFDKTLKQEVNLLQEAANASQLRRDFLQSDELYIPKIYWEYTREKVLMMEKINGISIGDFDALKQSGVDLKRLSEMSVTLLFKQVVENRFFHADMHPGNIFVCLDNPQKPYFIAVDFGIMGTLTPTDRRLLAEILLAFFKRDYHRLASLHIECGWTPADNRLDEFEAAIRCVCEPIFEKPLKDISFSQLFTGLFKVAKQFNMSIQPQLVLLQKTLFNVEGLGRDIYPELDLWVVAKPILEKWMRKQFSPNHLFKTLRHKAPRWLEQLPDLPETLLAGLQHKPTQRPIIAKKKNQQTAYKPFLFGAGLTCIITVLIERIALEPSWLSLDFHQWTSLQQGIVSAGILLLISPKLLSQKLN